MLSDLPLYPVRAPEHWHLREIERRPHHQEEEFHHPALKVLMHCLDIDLTTDPAITARPILRSVIQRPCHR